MSKAAPDPYDRIRAICAALPEVLERDSHGEATWFVGKRVFVTSADRHHDEELEARIVDAYRLIAPRSRSSRKKE